MNPLNPLFAIIAFLIACLTAYVLNLKYKLNNGSARYETIDGLRGFLGIAVFIHHTSIWHQYIHEGYWDSPKSNFYAHLGQTSVSLFFMITSFLFISKLLNTKNDYSWRAFFTSRVFRLAPMYFISIIILILFVLIISHWNLTVSLYAFLKSIVKWGSFTIIDNPDINNCAYTKIINAGVVWSLPYEWLFYFFLPIISLFILKSKPSYLYLAISIIFVLLYIHFNNVVPVRHILSFAGGAVAPFILKYSKSKINVNTIPFNLLLLTSLFMIVQFSTADNSYCKLFIAIVFTLIALGNNLFGLLKNSTLKFLGDICYSTYLMHGIVIFSVIYFGIGIENVSTFSPLKYCLLMFSITPIVVLVSFWGYIFIEKPFMDKAKIINGNKK